MADVAAASDQTALADDQAKVYDRQLRVWGLEVQNRLSAAKVLVAGGDGLASEVAKNLVLAGVGLVAVADDTPCSSSPMGNFLVPADSPETSSVAEAMVATLQAMNPLIRVVVQPGRASGLADDAVQAYDTIIASGLGFVQTQALEEKCIRLGKQLFSCLLRGPSSCVFVNLGTHSYTEKTKPKEGSDGEAPKIEARTVNYPSLEQALSTPLPKLSKKIHPLYAVARAAYAFEKQHGRVPTVDDVASLEACAAALVEAESGGKALGPHSKPQADLVQAWACMGAELAPVSAVVGGVVANNVIRAISHVNAPIKNLFFFSLFNNQGMVEDMPLA